MQYCMYSFRWNSTKSRSWDFFTIQQIFTEITLMTYYSWKHWRRREFKVGGTKRRRGVGVRRGCSPPRGCEEGMFLSPSGEPGSGKGQFSYFAISKWHILVNSEVPNLKFFSLLWAPSVRFGSILWQSLDFRAKQWIKDIIKCHCHWARTTNIGLLRISEVRKNTAEIFSLTSHQPKYLGYVTGIPAGVDASARKRLKMAQKESWTSFFATQPQRPTLFMLIFDKCCSDCQRVLTRGVIRRWTNQRPPANTQYFMHYREQKIHPFIHKKASASGALCSCCLRGCLINRVLEICGLSF